MKTLVLYTSKHGAAADIAEKLAKKMNGTACDLKRGNLPPLSGYDCVIVGGSLYAGMIGKEAKEFIAQNASALLEKRLGLFVCGLEEKNEQEYLKTNFPEEMLKAARAAKFLGGVFDPANAGFLEKLVMKVITKQSGRMDRTDDGKINAFAEEMMA